MNLTPMGDRVLLRKDEPETETEAGIILAEPVDKRTNEGTVVALGADVEIALEVGDRVLVSNFSGQGLDLEDKNLVMVRQSEVVCVVNDDG